MTELHSATNGLSEYNFLGEGSLGSVYKAELPNGQVRIQNLHLSFKLQYKVHNLSENLSFFSL